MAMTVEELELAAAGLSDQDRIELAERLVASAGPDPEIQRAWMIEAERRWQEIQTGQVEPIPAEQALADIRTRLHEKRQASSTGES